MATIGTANEKANLVLGDWQQNRHNKRMAITNFTPLLLPNHNQKPL